MHLRILAVTATVALTAACGAPPDRTQTSESSVAEGGGNAADTTPAPPRRPAPPPAEAQLPPSEPFDRVVSALRENGATVTSTASDLDGSLYVTGTFVGSIKLGGVSLASRGEEDVYLVKTYVDGSFAWGTTVGSAYQERAPAVNVEDGVVRLVGLTEGRLDCGNGPLPIWSNDTFFLCVFEPKDGENLEGGSFPIGSH